MATVTPSYNEAWRGSTMRQVFWFRPASTSRRFGATGPGCLSSGTADDDVIDIDSVIGHRGGDGWCGRHARHRVWPCAVFRPCHWKLGRGYALYACVVSDPLFSSSW